MPLIRYGILRPGYGTLPLDHFNIGSIGQDVALIRIIRKGNFQCRGIGFLRSTRIISFPLRLPDSGALGKRSKPLRGIRQLGRSGNVSHLIKLYGIQIQEGFILNFIPQNAGAGKLRSKRVDFYRPINDIGLFSRLFSLFSRLFQDFIP